MERFHREKGLSEIVGFILILAAIVVAVALWLTFGIPAQGREGEIQHMNQVKDRFVEYKINLDSLWTNRQCGTAIGTSFSLGTGGGATTGSFGLIPILSPVKTSAILALNQRTEVLTVAHDSYLMVDTGGYNETGSITGTTAITQSNVPRYFLVNISSSSIMDRKGVKINTSTWSAWVNMTPVYTFSRRFNVTNDSQGHITRFWEWNESRWNRTDITLTTAKGGVPLVEDLIIYREISPSTRYYVDLMNPLSGISTDLASATSLTGSRSDSSVNAGYLINYSYWPTVTTRDWNMGSLEYRAQNEYWIPQTYYYQLGGVFLEQDDGTTVKIPPSITFSMASDNVPVVKINEILLTGSGLVEASGPVQVTSSISEITETRMAAGNNTRYVNVSIQASTVNAAEMWLRALRDAADKAGFPGAIYTNNTAGTKTYVNISPDRNLYGVRLSLNKVSVTTAVQSAAPPGG